MMQSTHSNAADVPHESHHNGSVLTCENLSAQRGGISLYHQLGISLCEGAILVISADNGAGKTTLLKQIAGFARGHGNVRWFSGNITSYEHYDGDALYLSDKHGLYDKLTVQQQLDYIAATFGEPARLPAAIQYMQLSPYLPCRIEQLSAGWKRRVHLTRLLLVPALLWLLDEPMLHLDATGAGLLGGMIHSHAERGGVTILTMPTSEIAAPAIHNAPVSVLSLSDFFPEHA